MQATRHDNQQLLSRGKSRFMALIVILKLGAAPLHPASWLAATEKAWQSATTMAIEIGKKAPNFSLPDQTGKKRSLADFAGKNVILYFYPKDDTPGCTKEACGFRDAHDELSDLNTVVLGVSADGAAPHQKFISKYKLPFTLLSDEDRKVMESYGAYGEKLMYGKKVMGVIRSTVWIGPDGKVVRHWKRVPKAETHPAQVLEAIKNHE